MQLSSPLKNRSRSSTKSKGHYFAVCPLFGICSYGTLYFESFLKPLIIIIRIPLPLAGISFALFITGTPLSVTALIRIIMLTGMEINNGVLLITFIDELMETAQRNSGCHKRGCYCSTSPHFNYRYQQSFWLVAPGAAFGGWNRDAPANGYCGNWRFDLWVAAGIYFSSGRLSDIVWKEGQYLIE